MLRVQAVCKSFSSEAGDVPVLRNVSLDVAAGEFLAVVGRSGSGKSTLLNVLCSLIVPDAGRVLYKGRDTAAMSERERTLLRRHEFAMVFQAHHLMPYLTVLENVLLPCMTGLRAVPGSLRRKARECLAAVGLEGREGSLPRALSGGEQQRVALARGLVTGASVLFADEPTGSLDPATGDTVMELLRQLNAGGMTVVLVTHAPEYAALAGRTLTMDNGALLPDSA